jgi:hydrogenase expression/formation protein HypE
VFAAGHALHAMRDPTRGGLTTALCDLAEASRVGVRVRENALPVAPMIAAACDLLGLDPLNVANEGKAMLVCPAEEAPEVLEKIRRHPLGTHAAVIGEVTADAPGVVVLETRIGGQRVLTPPAGFDLPRIC